MPWVKGSEQPKKKYVSMKHFAEYFDFPTSSAYKLIKEPKYSEMVKRTDIGIKIDLNLAEKLIIGG